jgi:hypothetical protein
VTFALVVLVAMATSGFVQVFVLAEGLTQEQCEAELMTAPLPYSVNGHTITYECEVELK